jgi:subtilisin family serine protease
VAAGNSFATTYVTGICTLILAKHPGLTPFQLKTVLRETAANPEGV